MTERIGSEIDRTHNASIDVALSGAAHFDGGPWITRAEFVTGVADRFAERRRRGETPSLSEPVAGDLLLAIACDYGKDPAWNRFHIEHLPPLAAAARRRGGNAGSEAADEFPSYLAEPVRDRFHARRIGAYEGSSRLRTWLMVLLYRRIAEQRRRRGSLVTTDKNAEAAEKSGAPHGIDPVVKKEIAEAARAALASAEGKMTPKERLAFQLRWFERLPLAAVARALSVGAPRASEIIAQAAAKVRAAFDHAMKDDSPGKKKVGDETWQALKDAVAERMRDVNK